MQLLEPLKRRPRLRETLDQEGSFRRGGIRRFEIETEARSSRRATRDLPAAVRAGSFRADLFESLESVSIALPPLRERAVDIAILAQAVRARVRRSSAAARSRSEAIDALQDYPWPGNLRELRNVLERAVLLARRRRLFTRTICRCRRPCASPSRSDDAPLSLEEVERRHIAAVLQRTQLASGQGREPARHFAKTLYRKIREYGFERPAGVGAP